MEIRITLRIPVALHTELTEEAAIQRRSLNSQIVLLLERALKLDPLIEATRREAGVEE